MEKPRRKNILGIPGIHLSKKPRMSMHFGRTWDVADGFLPPVGEQPSVVVKCHLDTSWGTKFYFQHESVWYSGSIDQFKVGPILEFHMYNL